MNKRKNYEPKKKNMNQGKNMNQLKRYEPTKKVSMNGKKCERKKVPGAGTFVNRRP